MNLKKQKIDRAKTWHTQAENALDFAKTIHEGFDTADYKLKKQLLFNLCTNFKLFEGNLRTQLDKTLQCFENEDKWENTYKGKFEPGKNTDAQAKSADLVPANPVWLPVVEQIRNYFV